MDNNILNINIENLSSIPELKNIGKTLSQENQKLLLSGLKGGSKSFVIANLMKYSLKKIIIIVDSIHYARQLKEELEFFLGQNTQKKIMNYPNEDFSPYHNLYSDRTNIKERVNVLFNLLIKNYSIIITTAQSFFSYTIPKFILSANCFKLKVAEIYNIEELKEKFVSIGYFNTPIVEEQGCFTWRGGILDIFPPYSSSSYRVEFYDEMIENIKIFDPFKQSVNNESKDEIWVCPVGEIIKSEQSISTLKESIRHQGDNLLIPTRKVNQILDLLLNTYSFLGNEQKWLPAFYGNKNSIHDYLSGEELIIIDEPSKVSEKWNNIWTEFETLYNQEKESGEFVYEPQKYLIEPQNIQDRMLNHKRLVGISENLFFEFGSIWEGGNQNKTENIKDINLNTYKIPAPEDNLTIKKNTISDYIYKLKQEADELGLTVIIAASSQGQAQRLKDIIAWDENSFSQIEIKTDWKVPDINNIQIVIGSLFNGFILPSEGIIFISENELLGVKSNHLHRQSRRSSLSEKRKQLLSLGEIKPGDIVVHVHHGIGKYIGLETKKIKDNEIEFVVLEYKGKDKLYIPIYKLQQLHKYIGDKEKVKLDEIGGISFFKKKEKVSKITEKIADNLLRLYALRKSVEGTTYPEFEDMYAKLEAEFPFEETPDQKKAIDEVMFDLGNNKPMDRLLCGDVGFGKTEVALRAALRVALYGKQVAILVPTTVLAQQHFITFSQRLKNWPITVDLLSRFRTSSEQTKTVKSIQQRKVDIVIGTHRLLSKDIFFSDLGLLIIDEEHRFGVEHKERLKELKKDVEVLTLTATPIPRTLNMALSGVRDLSLITTPPPGRQSIKTFIVPEDEKVIKEAIIREISRGGQVFFVTRKVQGIEEKADKIKKIVPDARICIAHGQMNEDKLEETMIDFMNHQYDVMICTTIIESGLDITNVNTIIIDEAHNFGLAQLYQLRGRVGRSPRQAFAYLIVPPQSKLTDKAKERIGALKQFSALGSGYNIATIDMEIRGIGEMLGQAQSGQITNVGLEMFSILLQEAVTKLKGESYRPVQEPDLNFPESAYIPSSYIEDPSIRFNIYHTLNSVENEEELEEYKATIIDQYGNLPQEVANLIKVIKIKIAAQCLGIIGIDANDKQTVFHIGLNTLLDPNLIVNEISKPKSMFKLKDEIKLIRIWQDKDKGETIIDRVINILPDLWRYVNNTNKSIANS